MRCLEAPLLTVGNNTAVAEDLLRNGGLSCPGCGGRLGGWGHAVSRRVFRAGRVPVSVRPRRARCGSCRATHVLLPAWVLARRCDGTAVIGDMLARAARGQGFRSIAAASGVPEDTVRGRLRRFRASAGRVREFFTRLAGALSPDPVPLGRRAASWGMRWCRSPRPGPRRRAGGRRSRCRAGSWRRRLRRGRFCPRPSPSPEVPQIFRTGNPIGFSPERNGIECQENRSITLRSSRSRP